MNRDTVGLREFLLSPKSEDAKRPLVYPLFRSMFGKEFRVESDAQGADGYVEGRLLVELKTKNEDWLSGLYQGLHYQKQGLSFPNICVISHKFLGLWRVNDLPRSALNLARDADSQVRPSDMGRINANKTGKADAASILKAHMCLLKKDDFGGLFVDANIQV